MCMCAGGSARSLATRHSLLRQTPLQVLMIVTLALFHFLLCTHIITLGKNDDSYKLGTSHIDTNLQFDNIPRDSLRDFAVENIDVNRLRRKVDELLLTQENAPRPIETRRAPFFHFYEGLNPYYQAETARVRRRIVDNMVQLLYMARFTVKRMQTSEYYTPTDSSFRMGYTYRTGQSHMKKMNLAYKTGLHNYKKWHNTTYHIVIHTKVVKNHLNYVYVYWVAVKIDNVMKQYRQTMQRVQAARVKKMKQLEKLTTTNNPALENKTTETTTTPTNDNKPNNNGQ